jgi:serine/threonine protein kinase
MSGGTFKLGDFGIGRTAEQAVAEAQSGAWTYTPPEILSGLPYNFRSDAWSLGVMMYQMLTGEVPFTKLVDVLLKPPAPLPPTVPPSLADVVLLGMLEKKDADRLTMKQMETNVTLGRLPVVVWRDSKLRNPANDQILKEVQRRFAGRITLIGCETNEDAHQVLEMSMSINPDKVFVITSRGDGGEKFCHECKGNGIKSQILCFCGFAGNFPPIPGVTVDTKNDAVERFIEGYVLRA